MNILDQETWEHLISDFGEQAIRHLTGQPPLPDLPMPLEGTIRHRLLNAFCEQQAFWRKRSWPRFPREATWFWTDTLLQQASDWQTAQFKAQQFPVGALVHDFCCGAGVDAVALSDHHDVVAIDMAPLACFLTQANYRWNRQPAEATELRNKPYSFSVQCADVADHLDNLSGWVHVDPDRRPDEQRTTSIEWMQPTLESLEPLLTQCQGGMIKIAPASEVVSPWIENSCRLWIGDRRQCRQQLLIWGLPQFPTGKHGAISLDTNGTPAQFFSVPEEEAGSTTQPGRFVFDFHPSLRASLLTAAFANSLGIESLGDLSGYMTSDKPIDDPLVDAYEVLESLPWDEKKVKRVLRERKIGSLVVKKRGCKGLDPNRLQTSLPDKRGDQKATLVLAEVYKKQVALLVQPHG